MVVLVTLLYPGRGLTWGEVCVCGCNSKGRGEHVCRVYEEEGGMSRQKNWSHFTPFLCVTQTLLFLHYSPAGGSDPPGKVLLELAEAAVFCFSNVQSKV